MSEKYTGAVLVKKMTMCTFLTYFIGKNQLNHTLSTIIDKKRLIILNKKHNVHCIDATSVNTCN